MLMRVSKNLYFSNPFEVLQKILTCFDNLIKTSYIVSNHNEDLSSVQTSYVYLLGKEQRIIKIKSCDL